MPLAFFTGLSDGVPFGGVPFGGTGGGGVDDPEIYDMIDVPLCLLTVSDCTRDTYHAPSRAPVPFDTTTGNNLPAWAGSFRRR